MSKTPITEEWLNRNGKRMDELYEESMMCKEWVLRDYNDNGVARVIWSQYEPYSITVVAFKIIRDDSPIIKNRDARIIGAKYVEDIIEVLRFCGYNDIADKIKTDKI